MECSVVPMTKEHRKQVVDIYNYFIENTFAAYPDTAMDDSIFDRFLALSQDYLSLIAKDQAENVIGFAFLLIIDRICHSPVVPTFFIYICMSENGFTH